MRKRIFLSTIFLLSIVLIGCNRNEKPKNFDYGHIDNNKYVNSYFDFEITLPDGWIVQNKDQMDKLASSGKDLITGDDPKMKAAFEASKINTANLLSVFQFEQGSPVDFNPSFLLVAENVKYSPGIRTGSDYLFHARRLLEQSQLKYDHIDKEFAKEVINGTDFYKMNAEINYGNMMITQTYYSTISKEFSFNAIITYIDDGQKKILLDAINSMKFRR